MFLLKLCTSPPISMKRASPGALCALSPARADARGASLRPQLRGKAEYKDGREPSLDQLTPAKTAATEIFERLLRTQALYITLLRRSSIRLLKGSVLLSF